MEQSGLLATSMRSTLSYTFVSFALPIAPGDQSSSGTQCNSPHGRMRKLSCTLCFNFHHQQVRSLRREGEMSAGRQGQQE